MIIQIDFFESFVEDALRKFFILENEKFSRVLHHSKILYIYKNPKKEKIFDLILNKSLKDLIPPNLDILSHSGGGIYFLLGDCFPKDNILFQNIKNEKFNHILNLFEKFYPQTKYILKERNIKFGEDIFNQVAENIFNSSIKKFKSLSKEVRICFLKNKNLEADSLLNFLSKLFGSQNLKINLPKRKFILSLNRLLKSKFSIESKIKNPNLKYILLEMITYLNESLDLDLKF